MLQTSNLETRRSWGRPKYSYWKNWDREVVDDWDDLSLDSDEEGYCLSCALPIGRTSELTFFCYVCLDWSRQSNLDEHWDDLGGPG